MAWTNAKFGSVLTRNRDGSERDKSRIWQPPKMQILIPPKGQDHARPFVLFESDDPAETVRLILHEDRIDAERDGEVFAVLEL